LLILSLSENNPHNDFLMLLFLMLLCLTQYSMCILIWFTYYIRACQDYEKIHEVEVKLYKLPKFKIEVEVPSYIYPKSSGVPVKLKGTW